MLGLRLDRNGVRVGVKFWVKVKVTGSQWVSRVGVGLWLIFDNMRRNGKYYDTE